MATSTDYINQLKADKQTLVNNLVAKGVTATNDETFTTLVPKVADIQSSSATLGTKTITANGTYKAENDNLDGYSEVTVETSGVDINDYYLMQLSETNPKIIRYIKQIPLLDTSNVTNMYATFANLTNITTMPLIDTSNVTNMNYMFSSCSKLTSIPQLDTSKVTNMSNMFSNCSKLTTIPLLNTSNVTDMSNMFSSCSSLTSIPQLDTSKVINTSNMFSSCSKLTSIPQLDTSNVSNVYSMFSYCNNITELGGFENLGQRYSTTSSANYSFYMLNLSSLTKLTEQSIINVLNNLYDIKTKGCNTQKVMLGNTNLAKLTSTEGLAALKQAQDYGWTVS